MKVSIQIANQYSNVDLLSIPTEQMLQKIGAQLGAVEDVVDWTPRFAGIYVVKIVEVNDHPDADKLHVCLIDDGGVVENVDRNADGLVQIVCGAPDVAPGLTVIWITPGAIVPSTFDKDPFVLEVRAIRGVPSPGMLGTPSELGISDDRSGLLIVDELEVGQELSRPGTPFVKLYGLEDVVIDCENKMFTHRPDCFGILGVARELAGISGLPFESPEWYKQPVSLPAAQNVLPLEVFNFVPELSKRFMAVVIDNITIKPSPYWMQAALTRVGIRPINNVVDITNYMMQLTGQPMHAFDYRKIAEYSDGTPSIGVRMAKEGEALTVLSGKQLTLTAGDIVLSTNTTVADLAGVMGGGHTEIDANTTSIVLTCASFDMYSIRRSTMRHGVFTDAATRYTKGQSILQNDRVLAYAASHILNLANGTIASEIFDDPGDLHPLGNVIVNAEFINSRLDVNLDPFVIAQLLRNVEFVVDIQENILSITVPFWRTDIEIPEDIVEEVGRLYGFDKLPVVLPKRSSAPVTKNMALELNTKLRNSLVRAGANEVLSYSFVSGKLLDSVNQNTKEAYKLSNALSPELQYYRLTVTPSLLSKVYGNLRAGYDSFAIFEIGKTHLKLQGVNEEGLPQENSMLALVYAANDKHVAKNAGAAYYQAKRYLEHVSSLLGLDLDYVPLTDDITYEITKPFQPGRSALVTDRTSGNYIGVIGEYTPSTRSKLKLPVHSAGFEIMLDPLLDIATKLNYTALSKYPKMSQDVTLSVSPDQSYGSIQNSILNSIKEVGKDTGYISKLLPLGIYHKDKTKHKNVSFRIQLTSLQRTLTTEEVTTYVGKVVDLVEAELGAKRV